jgi:hypothetical protein
MAYRPPALVEEVQKKLGDAMKSHATFVRRYEQSERAYQGMLSVASDAAKWRHKLAPPYAFNLIETIVCNTVEMGLRFDTRPAPHANMGLEEATQMLAQAEAVGDLLRHEHRVDEMDYKQRPLFLCASIGGTGVGKTYWNYVEGSVKRQGVKMVQAGDPEAGLSLEVPVITEVEERNVIRDHSTFEVVDPRDFILHESARSLQPLEPGGAQHLFHRCWYSFEQLKMMEGAGYLKNVDVLKDHALDFSGEYSDRAREVWDVDRSKDLIEVLEYWCFKNGQVYRSLIGNKAVLLRDEEANPFWHGGYPFVLSSSMPQPFSPRGKSDIELIEALQEVLWEMMNQRLDNIELINNAILLIRSDVEDPEAFEHYPGARWPTDGKPSDTADWLMPPYQLAEITTHAEALAKGDLQNVTSAAPFAGGAETATVDQKTATGASIVMNAAQQRLTAKKYQAQQGLRQEATQRIKNCQQFISDQRLVHILGPDGVPTFRNISPLDIQGEFVVELEPMGESEMRQERRAEGGAFFQTVMQAAPLMAAAGSPLNLRELFAWYAKRWGVDDWERFVSQQAPAMGAAGGAPQPGGGGAPSGEGAPAGPNLGVTSETAVDASSPSATGGISMSPADMLSRALSMSGGPANAMGG